MMMSSYGNIFRLTGLLYGGIPQSPLNSLHKVHCCRALMFSLICAWINGWVNNPEAGELSRSLWHHCCVDHEKRKHVCLFSQNCACWWPSTIMCWDICGHSDDQICIPYVQCIITWSIFFQILTKDTPYLTHDGEVFCEFNLWLSSVPVVAVPYIIPCYIGSHYNSTPLYMSLALQGMISFDRIKIGVKESMPIRWVSAKKT